MASFRKEMDDVAQTSHIHRVVLGDECEKEPSGNETGLDQKYRRRFRLVVYEDFEWCDDIFIEHAHGKFSSPKGIHRRHVSFISEILYQKPRYVFERFELEDTRVAIA